MDDMFDRVEVKLGCLVMHLLAVFIIRYFRLMVRPIFAKQLKLRWYGSKSVVKYPRCSIRRHSTYADAEVTWLSNFDYLKTISISDSFWCLLHAGLGVVPLSYSNTFCG